MHQRQSGWKSLKLAVAAAALALLAGPALGAVSAPNALDTPGESTGPIPVGGGWQYFFWWGNTVYGAPFTFTEALPVTLRVTDAFCYGDQFRVSDNGVVVGDTSKPTKNTCGGPSSPDAAYKDKAMSSGCFILLPGAHSITLELIKNPFGGGGAYLRADTIDDYIGLECLPLPAL